MARILIVDDDALVRDHAALCLRGAGHDVTTAVDGEAGLRAARADWFDLVVTDVYMPRLDGFAFAGRLREALGPLTPPMVFMSSVEDRQHYRKALRLRAVDFLVKPVGCEALREAVRSRLGDEGDGAAGRIPGFQLRRALGTGATASVYLATRLPAGEECAVKVIHLPAEAEDQGETIRAFDREFSILETLDHPGIARVLEHGVSDECLYIAMEYFPGGSLALEPGRPMEPARAAGTCREIAEALGFIHARGIVHRDLKPTNVMRRADGSLALVDFGIARHDSHHLTGAAFGTPLYMSPEQFGAERVDARADVYALGCMLFQMLTGRRPFEGASIAELCAAHGTGPRPRLPDHLAACQPVLERMVSADRAARYADGAACVPPLQMLEGLLTHRQARQRLRTHPDLEV